VLAAATGAGAGVVLTREESADRALELIGGRSLNKAARRARRSKK